MKKAALLVLGGVMAWGQANQGARPAPPPSHQYFKVHQYTAEEDSSMLQLYEGLRVADVIDALDAVGLPEVTMMDKHIRPLWRDEQKITHRIHGIALTVRLVPAQATAREFKSHADERVWETGEWGPPAEMRTDTGGRGPNYMGLIHPGTVLVVEGNAHDNGFCGSNNALSMVGRGLRGLVGNAVCRDTDELTLTRIPVYQDPMEAPRGINQGRMWVESYNEPVVVGGVLVMPGDVIVADNDGVAVVPRARGEQVAEIAGWIFHDDEIKRGKIYDSVGRPRDWTVLGHKDPPAPTSTPIQH
jgi:4-hydroxy-4-methyl-2-oxoglutarate aldolase